MKFSERIAWSIVECVKKTIEERNEFIYSAVVYGSLLRGDFTPNVSDIDLLLVFKKNTPINKINNLLNEIWKCAEKYYGLSNYEKIIDILWIYENELLLKDTDVESPFKCLSIYAFDFVKYSKVIRGVDFRKELKVQNPKVLVEKRAKRILELLEKFYSERKYNMIEILAGEAIRLAQIHYGELTIDKRKVFKNFMKYVPEYPSKKLAEKIWTKYLTQDKKPLSSKELEEYIKFIKETVALVLKNQQGGFLH